MLKKIIKDLVKRFFNCYLCNRQCCYRVVTRKNGVCDFCKCKKK